MADKLRNTTNIQGDENRRTIEQPSQSSQLSLHTKSHLQNYNYNVKIYNPINEQKSSLSSTNEDNISSSTSIPSSMKKPTTVISLVDDDNIKPVHSYSMLNRENTKIRKDQIPSMDSIIHQKIS